MPTATDPALERDAQELYEALRDLIRVYQCRDRDRICCHDLTPAQSHALRHLMEDGPLTVNELAAALYLDKSTTSRLVAGLEHKKLLQRLVHPEDGRAVHLRATPAGRKRHRQITDDLRERETRMLAGFRPEVRRSMIDLIHRLGQTAAARVDTSGGTCCCLD